MKLKIRFLINSLAGGGAEKVLVDLLNRLDPEKYALELITVTGGVHQQRLPLYVKHRQIVRLKNEKLRRMFSKLVNKMPYRLFATFFLQGNFDMEIAYLEGKPTRFVAAKSGKGKKIAFVHCDISVNNIIASCYHDSTECLCEYQSFDRVCFVSEQSKRGFESTIGPLENACVIHNVIDIEGIKQLSEKAPYAQYSTKGWKLVTVGRLAPEKAYDRLLYCIADLEKLFSVELFIIGEGPEREQLEKIIKENNIHSVRLLGYQNNPYSIMRQADLFICSSIFEGYSTAVTEAIALGVPVITTDCAGMDEILEQGRCGVVVENTKEALFKGILDLCENKGKYNDLKRNIEHRQKSQCDIATKEYAELFLNIM